jgi:two-component system response regulator HupR/HoxA
MGTDKERNTVLFVDDEINILSSIRRATMDEAFECVCANSGQEALEVLEKRAVSVIVTDMRMPGMDGLTLLKAVREKYPKTVRIVLSGYTQVSQLLATVNHGDIFQFIPKPWKMEEELLVVVRQAIEHYNLEVERDNLREGLEQKNKAYQNIFRTMEQKLANEKKDLINLKRINHWIFSFWKKLLETDSSEENSAAAKRYVDLIEELQLLYIDILPTLTEVKTPDEIMADATKACAGRIVFQNSGGSDRKIAGYHGFLTMALKAIVYLVTADTKEQAVCKLTVEANAGVTILITSDIPQLVKLSAIEHSKLKIGCSLLNEMGKLYGISLQPEGTNDEVTSIRIVLTTSKG